MKKFTILIAALALVCFSVPAMADWSFYGSARMQTFWTDTDLGDTPLANGDDDDNDLRWDFQTNSRLGANVKADAVSGRIELGLKGTDGGDIDVGTRRAYGTWDFGAGKLKVGKDYTPISQFISGQVFDEDWGLVGQGFMYARRPGQVALSFGGFEVALITPRSDTISTSGAGAAGGAFGSGDIDEYLPKIEASYGMAFDAFNFAIRGGAQTYKVEDVVSLVDGSTNDIDVTSYAIGADAGFNFGPAYIGGAVSYTVNGGNASWLAGAATFDGDDDVEDVNTIQAGLVGKLKVSDMLTFEVGGGWRQDDPDDAPSGRDEKTTTWAVYGQSVIALAPGVYLIPEIGYYDKGDSAADVDQGDLWYAGAKWQIDF
jgi:hypothetical protein